MQLQVAALIIGRVVDGVTKQPVPNARVQAFASQPNPDIEAGTHFAVFSTDARGEYRITTLRAGTYDLWADAPNRVNGGIKKLQTSSERPTAAPDLVMIGGGTIRVRLMDDKTRQHVPIKGDERA